LNPPEADKGSMPRRLQQGGSSCRFSGNDLIGYRAVFNTTAAPGTPVEPDAPRPFPDFYPEIPRSTGYGLQVGIGDQLNVHVPADLDQLG